MSKNPTATPWMSLLRAGRVAPEIANALRHLHLIPTPAGVITTPPTWEERVRALAVLHDYQHRDGKRRTDSWGDAMRGGRRGY